MTIISLKQILHDFPARKALQLKKGIGISANRAGIDVGNFRHLPRANEEGTKRSNIEEKHRRPSLTV